LVADELVHETADLPGFFADTVAYARVLPFKVCNHLTHRRGIDRYFGNATGSASQRCGDAYRRAHLFASNWAEKASSDGGIVIVGRAVSETASIVFNPSPVMRATVFSSGRTSPRSASFRSVAIVTPPAVSVKRSEEHTS